MKPNTPRTTPTTPRFLTRLGAAFLTAALLAATAFQAQADSVKADNTDDLDLATSWTNGIVPTAALAIWDETVTTNNVVTIGNGVSFAGIKITNLGTNLVDVATNVVINPGAGGTLTLGASGVDLSASTNTLTLASTVTLGANQTWKTDTSGATAATQITVNGIVSGAGRLTLDAANTRPVDLNAANTFTGGFTLNPGSSVRYGVAAVVSGVNTVSSPLGAYDGTQALVINGGRINNPNVAFHARNITLNGDFTFNNSFRTAFNGLFDMAGGPRTIIMTRQTSPASAVIVGGNCALQITAGSTFSNGVIRFAADASVGAGNFCVLNFGTSANANFVTNTPLVLGEKVMATAASGSFNTAASVPSVTLEAGSWWNLSENATIRSPQVNSLAGSGTVATLYTGTTANTLGTLTIKGNSGTTTEFTGRIVNTDTNVFATATNGITAVTKAGGTTQILSGTNTYTGLTTISGGKLVTSTVSSNGHYTLSAGTTLGVKVAAAGTSLSISNLTLATGSVLEIDLGSLGNPTAPVIASAGTNSVTGTVTVNLRGSKSAMTYGTFTVLTSAVRTGTGSYVLGTIPAGLNATLTDGGTTVTIAINAINPLWVWSGTAGSDWNIGVAGNLNWLDDSLAGVFYNEPGLGVVFDDTVAGATNVNVTAVVAPPSVTLANSAKNFSFSGSGRISGAAGLTKEGTGTVTMGTLNDYAGATTITAGTLKLGASNVLPDGSGKGNVSLTGTLDLAGFSDTVNGLNGGGTVNNSAGSGALTVGNNDAAFSFGGVIANAGGTLSLTKVGAGTATFSGNSTYTGGTLLSAGTVQVTAGRLGAGPVTNNTTLIYDFGTSSGSVTNVIAGTGELIKSGTGAITLSGNNTYSGQTLVTAGDLYVASSTALGSAAAGTVVSNGSSLRLQGDVTVNEPLSIAGLGAGSSPSGALRTWTGSNTWAGTITLASARVGTDNGTTNYLHLAGPVVGGGIQYTNSTPALHTRRGNVIFSGASTYLGDTAFGQGTNSIAGGNNRLPVTTVLHMGYGGQSWFDMNGLSQELAGLQLFFDSYGVNNLSVVFNYAPTPSILTVNAGARATDYKGILDGALTLVKTGTNTFTLSEGLNYHTNTIVNAGTLLVNGVNYNDPVTVNTGGTLGGSGSIIQSVTVNSGGALAPGVDGTGTLYIYGPLTLAGGSQTRVDINSDDSTSDNVNGPASATYAGTLVVNNVGVAAVTNTQSFTLFSATTHTGSFSSISPSSPATGLVWSFTNGVLTAVTGTTTADYATNITVSVSGGAMNLTWPGTHLGWYAQSNSVSLGDTNQWYDVAGSQNGTNLLVPINPAQGSVFYRLRHP